ncbi:MAG: tetratricopeptide repeat protein, partial [Coriobacteriales bacterium]|nr:tetratricopeptide repeat protein [Coriobacteriales bacterium]
MNSNYYIQAKTAYDAGDYAQALRGFYSCLKEDYASFEPGDAGLVYYRLGNCLMKIRSFNEAAATYKKALEDPDYQEKATTNTNLGTALVGLGNYEEAITHFKAALADPLNVKPYQAELGLGNAYSKLAMTIDAGTAYRNAALDERNPNPVRALINLGACFTALNRPGDAIEAYLAVLDFKASGTTLNKTYASLGQAYVATGRYQEAVNAFQDALRDGTYVLAPDAQQDYQKASSLLAAGDHDLSGLDTPPAPAAPAYEEAAPYPEEGYAQQSPEQGDQFYGAGNVPLASDTGFFTATDADLIELSKRQLRKERKLRHTGLKIFLALIILLVLALGAAVVAYTQGIGYPSQETVIEEFFAAHASGADVKPYWVDATGADADAIDRIMEMVTPSSQITIDYLERSMAQSNALVTAQLPEGGSLRYHLQLTRDKLGWKISDL